MNKNLVKIGEAAKIVGVSIDTLRRWDKSGRLSAIPTESGQTRYYRRSDIDLFINDPQALVKKWVLSSQAYEPDTQFYCKTRDIFQARLEHLKSDLSILSNEKISSLITAVAGEIGNNSYDHNLGNWPDILGIFFSYSLAQKKIILADRGLGILATLKKVKPELQDHKQALKVAFTQTVSGRAPENRGNGLKFVCHIVTHNAISLSFQTGNAFLELSEEKKEVNVQEIKDIFRGCTAIVEY